MLTEEEKSVMDRLGKMKFGIHRLVFDRTKYGIFEVGKDEDTRIAEIDVKAAERLGLAPGMEIMILPIAHVER